LLELSDGHATYEFSVRGTADFQWSAEEVSLLPAGAGAVHFGSLASWLPAGDEILNARIAGIRAAGSLLISYDPNARPGLQTDPGRARSTVQRSVALAHVIKASLDVTGLYGMENPADVADCWLSKRRQSLSSLHAVPAAPLPGLPGSGP
jgi:fructokinase